MSKPYLSIILPIFRNEETLEELYRQLKETLKDLSHEILFINDASPDDSQSVINALTEKDPQIVSFTFKKNRGQNCAILKGLEICQGAIAIAMDADLQDPPSMIPQLFTKIEEGFDGVFGGRCGNYESSFRLLTSKLFKAVIHKLCHVPKDAGTFVALSQNMIESLRRIEMSSPFLVAMIGLTGLKTCSIPFLRPKRKTGKTAYTSFMRLKIGIKTVFQLFQIKSKIAQAQKQRDYYSQADHFNIFPENHPLSIQRHLEHLCKHLPLTPDKKVLEVGCGMGRFTIPLAKKGLQIEGLDVSPHLLEKLHHFTDLIPTHCADLLTPLPKLKGKFDAVIGFFVLHHLPDQNKAFQAISNLLKPGGKILFIEPNPYNPLFYLQILFHPKMRWKNERYMLNMRPSPLFSAMKELTHYKMERFGFFPPFLQKKWHNLELKLEKIPLFSPFLPYQVFYAEKSDDDAHS